MAIPLLRLPTWYSALYAFLGLEYAKYEPPLQKLFYRPVFIFLWGVLAFVPFILIRRRWAYLTFCGAFAIIGGWLFYDEIAPFRYVAPNYSGAVPEDTFRYSTADDGYHTTFYISNFAPSSTEVQLELFFIVWPFLLGSLYHFAYVRNTRNA